MSDNTAIPTAGFNPDKSLDPRECPACRRMFTPYRSFQRACSKHCRKRLREINPDDLMPVHYTCRTCGKGAVGYTTGGGGRFKYCGDCQSEAQRRRNEQKNLNRRLDGTIEDEARRQKRRRSQMYKYGITVERYDEMLAAQHGVCAICGKPPSGKGTSGQSLHVDHDHSCCPGTKSCGECVRGLLCSNCNMAVGLLKDDPTILTAALRYVTNA